MFSFLHAFKAPAAYIFLSLVLLLGSLDKAKADFELKILAVVNNDVITAYDMVNRVKMILATTGLPNTAQTVKRIEKQVFDQLIDEKLKQQEAQRLDIVVTDKDVEDAFRNFEQQRGLPPGGYTDFLIQNQIDPETARQQIRADIGWARAVNRAFRGSISISDLDVQDALDALQKNAGKPEFNYGEIVLPVPSPALDNKVFSLGMRLSEEIAKGASFGNIAVQFSQAPSAVRGGMVGWKNINDLDPDIAEVLSKMEPGQLSPPIRTQLGYTILVLREKRIAQSPLDAGTKVLLAQYRIPPLDGGDTDFDKILNIAEETTSCQSMDTVAKKYNLPQSGIIGEVAVQNLSPEIRAKLAATQDKTLSKASRIDGYDVMLMVCERTLPDIEAFKNRLRQNLETQKLQRKAIQKLQTLRRMALIDRREAL
jgi:peptidyl-prolyl cis-trans isomerase SurA